MLKKIFSQSILYFLSMYTSLVANIFLLPIINKYLTVNDYAIYGLVYAYIGILAGFSDLGMIISFQNTYFKERENYRKIWSQLMGFLNIWRVFYGLGMFVLMYFMFRNRVDQDDLLLFLLLITIPVTFFDFTKSIGTRHCQFRGNHKVVHVATLISSLITLAVTFVTIYYYRMGFMGWLISAFVARCFEFIYFGIYLYFIQKIRPSFRFGIQLIRSKLRVSLPLLPQRYSNYLINSADRAMLDLAHTQWGVVSLAQIGLYNIAYNFANYFASFTQAVNTVVSPIYFTLFASEDQKDASKTIVSITYLWFTFNLAVGFALCLWLKEAIMFLYPKPEFHEAYKYSILIIMALCYRPFYVAIIDKVIFHEKTKVSMRIIMGAGLLNVALNIPAIPLFGIQGAVVTSFITYVALGFGPFLFKQFRAYIEPQFKPLQVTLILCAISALAFVCADLEMIYKAFLSIALVVVVLIWYKLKGRKIIFELNQIRIGNAH